jgi:thiamine pyrophosphokinase
MHKRAVILANGSLPNPMLVRHLIGRDDLLIVADGGTRHALALGLHPHVLIGDLDSLPAELQAGLQEAGTRILLYPRDKDETDLELALTFALEQNCDHILIVAALGGRLDQTLGNLALLTAPRLQALDVRLDDGVEEAFFVRKQAQIQGGAGEIVSLLPWGEDVNGISTSGLRWPLNGESLSPYQTRGISNEMLGKTATVRILSGLLLVIHRRLSANSNPEVL